MKKTAQRAGTKKTKKSRWSLIAILTGSLLILEIINQLLLLIK